MQAITSHRIIRLAEPLDLPAIMQVLDAAKQIMRASGNMHQWVNGYPSEAVIAADMQHNIAKHGFTYCGIIYLASGDERLAYQKII